MIDLDGVIAPVKNVNGDYATLRPLPGAVQRIRELRATGHDVIIWTARNMATCESNLGRAMKNIGKTTLDWLACHDVEYDEIYFGKPNAEIYIDDRAVRFQGWNHLDEEFLITNARAR